MEERRMVEQSTLRRRATSLMSMRHLRREVAIWFLRKLIREPECMEISVQWRSPEGFVERRLILLAGGSMGRGIEAAECRSLGFASGGIARAGGVGSFLLRAFLSSMIEGSGWSGGRPDFLRSTSMWESTF